MGSRPKCQVERQLQKLKSTKPLDTPPHFLVLCWQVKPVLFSAIQLGSKLGFLVNIIQLLN